MRSKISKGGSTIYAFIRLLDDTLMPLCDTFEAAILKQKKETKKKIKISQVKYSEKWHIQLKEKLGAVYF